MYFKENSKKKDFEQYKSNGNRFWKRIGVLSFR